jgi:hypothetical protein
VLNKQCSAKKAVEKVQEKKTHWMRVKSEQLYHVALPNESQSRSQCAGFEADYGLELATVSQQPVRREKFFGWGSGRVILAIIKCGCRWSVLRRAAYMSDRALRCYHRFFVLNLAARGSRAVLSSPNVSAAGKLLTMTEDDNMPTA